jgi:nuclear pore complex protein Nup62
LLSELAFRDQTPTLRCNTCITATPPLPCILCTQVHIPAEQNTHHHFRAETMAFSFGSAGANNNNANNNQQQNKSLFGGAATPSSGGGLFGSSSNTPAPSGGSLFGNAAASGGQQNSTFGSGTTTPQPSSGGLFGGAKTAASTGEQPKSMFGGAGTTPQPSSGGLFGGGAPAANGGAQKTGGSLFGNAAPAQSGTTTPLSGGFSFGQKKDEPKAAPTPASSGQSLFGAAPASTTPQTAAPTSTTPATGGMFGNKPATTGGISLFGQAKPQAATPPGGSNLFGGAQTPAGAPTSQQSKPPTSNLFGGGNNGASTPGTATGGSLFQGMGSKNASSTTPQANKTAPPSSLSFTPAGNPPSANLFGGGAAAAKPAPSLFSQAPKTGENKAPASAGGDAQPKPSFGFGNLNPTPPTADVNKLFDAKKPETPAQPTTEKPAEAPKSGSLFGGAFGKKPDASPATSTPGPTSNLFGGAGAAASSSSQPTCTPATAPASGASLFGGAPPTAAKPAETPGTDKPAAAPASSGGASLFGNTTTQQPAGQQTSQPAQPVSRLTGKSLDEILTSWSTSLATHQSRFAKLATQVGTWDRELTTNSTSISKLYSRCFQAERDVAEVERQLSTVEQGQRELEARLDKYEADVDGLLEQAGLSDSGGVDREREITYKAAETCSDRLMEMNQSLSAMIEGINDASSKLSSSSAASGKAAKDAGEDPLMQIVRVLNSHLAQLQVIDAGAIDLSKRVESAHVDVGVAGSRLGASMRGSTMSGNGGGGNDIAEGFKKSFFRSGERY